MRRRASPDQLSSERASQFANNEVRTADQVQLLAVQLDQNLLKVSNSRELTGLKRHKNFQRSN